MKFVPPGGLFSQQAGLLFNFLSGILLAILAIPLILDSQVLVDDTPAVNFRDPVTMLSFGEFAISVFTIPVFSLAIIGIVKRRSSLFLPYFGFTAAVIIAVLGYSLLALLKPGARTEAFCGFGLIIIEAQMLYSAMTFYFQLKMHWWEHHKESVVCEPAGKVRLAIQSKIKELPPSAV